MIKAAHLFYAGVDLLIICGILRDYFADGKISIIYRYALPAFIVLQSFAVYTWMTYPAFWQSAAHSIAP